MVVLQFLQVISNEKSIKTKFYNKLIKKNVMKFI